MYISSLEFPSCFKMVWEEEAGSEGPKLLHFVNKKTPPFCKGPGKEPLKIQEPLKIPWPHPTTLEPIRPQTKISWLYIVYLGNGNQSEPRASRGKMRINQKPTPNPSTEGNQLDVSQPRNSRFSNFSRENTLYKQCNPELEAPPYSRRVSIGWEPQLQLGN